MLVHFGCSQSAIANHKSQMKLVASPGFAPGPPVSETGALLITPRGKWSPGKVLPLRLLGVGQARYYFTTGRTLAAGAGIAPAFAPSKGAVLRLDDPAMNWWPARVTLPVQRIKSPLHHFNACRPKWCSRQDSHLHWRRSRRRVSAVGLRERTKWVLQPVLIRRDCFTKAICRLLRGGVDWPAEPRLNKAKVALPHRSR